MEKQNGLSGPEKPITIREAAEEVGAKYWHIQRLVKRGRIPHYLPYNSRRLVKLSEVVAYIDSSRQEGVE
ncbi:MAG TPA: excisionase family DNA-binding protein [Shinella sp.]|jgi:excisionase family DNA binding protein|uniref:excisionase family DNA-binding protein n=1 Tax=Shinella sp. TaxID=1870904 RepID=UPI002E0E7A76|nr:excisionase family DNA-binding protein [Shinella sp.]